MPEPSVVPALLVTLATKLPGLQEPCPAMMQVKTLILQQQADGTDWNARAQALLQDAHALLAEDCCEGRFWVPKPGLEPLLDALAQWGARSAMVCFPADGVSAHVILATPDGPRDGFGVDVYAALVAAAVKALRVKEGA